MDLNDLYKKINVTMGANCEVSPFCSLENVKMGNGVKIGEGVQLKNVEIGSGSKLGCNSRFYSSKQERPVSIGKNCWISYGVFGEATGGEIKISDYIVIAHNCSLLTSSGPGKMDMVMNEIYSEEDGDILIGKYSWIGAHCVLLPNILIGEGVVIGAISLLPAGKFADWSVFGGIPAKLLKTIDHQAVECALAKFNSGKK